MLRHILLAYQQLVLRIWVPTGQLLHMGGVFLLCNSPAKASYSRLYCDWAMNLWGIWLINMSSLLLWMLQELNQDLLHACVYSKKSCRDEFLQQTVIFCKKHCTEIIVTEQCQ